MSRRPDSYFNAVDHGCAVLEAGAGSLDVTCRAVTTIQRPDPSVRDPARFRVARGEIGPR